MSAKEILKASVPGLIMSAIGLLCFFIFARAYTLSCERGVKDQVSCVKSSNILGIVNFKDEHLESLYRAWVSDHCDSDGCTYRVELDTTRRTIPLTSYSSSGYQSKENMADKINTFIDDPSQQSLEIKTSTGLLGTLLPGIFVLLGPYIAYQQIRKRSAGSGYVYREE